MPDIPALPWEPQDTVSALKQAYLQEVHPVKRTRLPALWLLRRDWSPRDTADAVGVHLRSVHRWMSWYRAEGLPAVRERLKGGYGKPSFLTPAQEAQVIARANEGRFFTAQEARDWIETEFGVTYTETSIYTLWHRLGLRLKRPRPVHEKADPQAQQAWKKGGCKRRSKRPI